MKAIVGVVLFLVVTSAATGQIPTNGLVASWPFTGSVADSSGNGNNGYTADPSYTSDQWGHAEGAYHFNGVDNFIRIPNSPTLNPSGQLTITCWLQVDTIADNYMDVFVKGGAAYNNFANREYALYVKMHVWPYYYLELKSAGDSLGQHELNSQAHRPGEWVFVALVIDRINHQMRIYENGVPADSTADSYSTFNLNTDSLYIGWSKEYLSQHVPFRGSLDRMRMYDRTLTDGEIAALYAEGGWLLLPSMPALSAPAQGCQVYAYKDSLLFTWGSSAPAVTEYSLELSTDSLLSAVTVDSTLTDNQTMAFLPAGSGKYWWRVRAKNAAGWGPFSELRSFDFIITGVHDAVAAPAGYRLSEAFPNPFNPSTTIWFSMATRARVTLSVYTLLGERVATLVDDVKDPGSYEVQWNAANMSSGIYYCRMTAGEFSETRKMVVVR